VTDYPASWRDRLEDLCGELELTVAGLSTRIQLRRAELEGAYLPVLALLHEKAQTASTRVVAGLAGIPGGGKSTFAEVLRHLATRLVPEDGLTVMPLDGWHWSNLTHERKRIRDADGRMVPLKESKGCPESFNAPVYAHHLRRLREPTFELAIPLYDRERHEPVPDAMTITRDARVILAEGNYLLAQMPPWDEVFEAIAPRFYLACDPELARQRVIARHQRGGRSEQEAVARFRRNDAHNTQIVLGTAAHADYEIAFTPCPQVVALGRSNDTFT